jgi:6,7-dimethyl-8-ribityllumazine synthase
MSTFSAKARGGGRRIGIAVSRFNDIITERLLVGARSCLADHGFTDEDVDVAWVPGAWELPLAAQHLIERRGCAAVIALGCVIRGDTPHFDFVAGGATTALASLQSRTGIPVGFGLLTTDTMEQALARAGGKAGNKGWESALAALETLGLIDAMEADGGS